MQINDLTNFLGVTDTKRTDPVPSAQPVFDLEKVGSKQTLYEWDAPSRVVKTVNKKMIKNLVIIAVVISLLFIAMQEFLLVIAIVSLAFVSYILSATPSETVHNVITSHGVEYGGRFYYWNELKHYFFSERQGTSILCVDAKEGLPARIYMTLRPGDKDPLHKIVGSYLPYLQEEPRSAVDRMYYSVIDKLNFGDAESSKS